MRFIIRIRNKSIPDRHNAEILADFLIIERWEIRHIVDITSFSFHDGSYTK